MIKDTDRSAPQFPAVIGHAKWDNPFINPHL
jgi:hypothetical protein